jgi:hypothetical protein
MRIIARFQARQLPLSKDATLLHKLGITLFAQL